MTIASTLSLLTSTAIGIETDLSIKVTRLDLNESGIAGYAYRLGHQPLMLYTYFKNLSLKF